LGYPEILLVIYHHPEITGHLHLKTPWGGQHWPAKRPTIFYHDKDYHFSGVALQYYTGMNIAGSEPVL